jgi:peptide deformylase
MKSTLSKFYTIETWTNNEILRKKSEKIAKIDEDLINLWNDMIELMYENDWVGLAAPKFERTSEWLL